MSLAHFIDHTILKPTTGLGDIETICSEAMTQGFAAVCIPPYYVRDARQILEASGVKLATVIGFPFGYSHYRAKSAEAAQAVEDGAQELDMVMNLAAFKSNDMAYLESEIDEILKVAGEKAGLKVIIESGVLSEEEILRCCALYRHYPIRFLKTSTGYAEKGASVDAVRLMRNHLPPSIGVKASGGIRSYDVARQLVNAGATRLGCSASVQIIREEKERGNVEYRAEES